MELEFRLKRFNFEPTSSTPCHTRSEISRHQLEVSVMLGAQAIHNPTVCDASQQWDEPGGRVGISFSALKLFSLILAPWALRGVWEVRGQGMFIGAVDKPILQQVPPESSTYFAVWVVRWSECGAPELCCPWALSSVGDAFLWAESQ